MDTFKLTSMVWRFINMLEEYVPICVCSLHATQLNCEVVTNINMLLIMYVSNALFLKQ